MAWALTMETYDSKPSGRDAATSSPLTIHDEINRRALMDTHATSSIVALSDHAGWNVTKPTPVAAAAAPLVFPEKYSNQSLAYSTSSEGVGIYPKLNTNTSWSRVARRHHDDDDSLSFALDDDDDDTVSDCNMIAIGIPEEIKKPAAKKTPPSAAALLTAPRSEAEATEQVVTELVALDLAAQEHKDAKKQHVSTAAASATRRLPPRRTVALPRTAAAAAAAPKTRSANSGHALSPTSLHQASTSLASRHYYPPNDDEEAPTLAGPGAFAVEGIDASQHSYDSVFEERSVASWGNHVESTEGDLLNLNQDPPAVSNPLVAELHEEYYVDDNAVVIVNDDEEHVDPKIIRRIQKTQVTMFFLLLTGVAMVVTSWATAGSKAPPSDAAPVVEGWASVGPWGMEAPAESLGDNHDVLFGAVVSMSSTGQTVAVAAPGFDLTKDIPFELDTGAVFVMQQTATTNGTTAWEHVVLHGPGASTAPHMALALSSNGTTLAAGYSRHGPGVVHVFGRKSETESFSAPFALRPEEDLHLVAPQSSSWFGHALDVSADGLVLAVGVPRAALEANSTIMSGRVNFYQKVEGRPSWEPLGDPIVGDESNLLCGWTLALAHFSDQGMAKRIAIGCRDQKRQGLVKIYDMPQGKLSSWVLVHEIAAPPQDHDEILSHFGDSLAISADGKVLVIGNRGLLGPGQVHTYREENGQWTPDEQFFVGNADGEGFGTALALSEDGSVLTIGAPGSDAFGKDSGRVLVLSYLENENKWSRIGSDIVGRENDGLGYSVAISADGRRVASSTPLPSVKQVGVFQSGYTLVMDRQE
jgi:hypothetical protein